MPHGESWFSVLPFLRPLYEWLLHAAHAFGRPFNDEGKTWIGGQPIGVQHVLAAGFVCLVLLIFAVVAFSRTRKPENALVPSDRLNITTLVELLAGATYKMMVDMMGAKAAKFFLPLIGTCAFFILFSNLLGLIPGFVPPTDNMNTTLACSLVILVTTQFFGVKEHGLIGWLLHFAGPLRKWWAIPVMALLFFLEVASHLLIRPGTLALRLGANMTADHLVLGVFHEVTKKLLPIPLLLPIPIYMLGVLVCVVQTVVFCMLSTMYIALAIQHDEEH